MGCMPNTPKITCKTKKNNIMIYQSLNFKVKTFNDNRNNTPTILKVSDSSWVNIANFLKFQELKEFGKTNKYFNNISKRHNVLVKFFKKQTFYNKLPKNTFLQFKNFCNFKTDIEINHTISSFS